MNVGTDGRTAAPPAPPGAAAMWAPFEHPPCTNWRRGREGCDGRHHLPQCPLPRPTLAVTDAEHAEAGDRRPLAGGPLWGRAGVD
eukprot:3547428-Prymnesium_polylepis.1